MSVVVLNWLAKLAGLTHRCRRRTTAERGKTGYYYSSETSEMSLFHNISDVETVYTLFSLLGECCGSCYVGETRGHLYDNAVDWAFADTNATFIGCVSVCKKRCITNEDDKWIWSCIFICQNQK